jgi:flagellar hook-associated protein 3 FlgL
VFATLDRIAATLRGGGNPSAELTALDAHRDALLEQASGVGARHNQIVAAQANALTLKTELTGQLSDVEDADLAASIVELQMQEVAYKAALGATGRVLQPTLMDFLR